MSDWQTFAEVKELLKRRETPTTCRIVVLENQDGEPLIYTNI